jgi:hypothetical protein
MPCTRVSPNSSDIFLGPTSLSASNIVTPCTRDQHARKAPAIFRWFREVFGIARPKPPFTMTPISRPLVVSAAARSIAGRPWVGCSSNLQTSICRELGFRHHVGCRHAIWRTAAREHLPVPRSHCSCGASSVQPRRLRPPPATHASRRTSLFVATCGARRRLLFFTSCFRSKNSYTGLCNFLFVTLPGEYCYFNPAWSGSALRPDQNKLG